MFYTIPKRRKPPDSPIAFAPKARVRAAMFFGAVRCCKRCYSIAKACCSLMFRRRRAMFHHPFKDASGPWTGMGIRARVIVYHASVTNPPQKLEDLLQPRSKAKSASAIRSWHGFRWVSALSTRWGHEKTVRYFRDLKRNGVRVLPGNSVVADKVQRGELLVGVTDSDDFYANVVKSSSKIRVQKYLRRHSDVVLIRVRSRF
jgi:hypothetical protein